MRIEVIRLMANEVDVWRIDLARQDRVRQCRSLLSPDEIRRAKRFYFERERARFTLARAAMRQILSLYAGIAPQELCFGYGSGGKPELCAGLEESGIRFNLSHSSQLALLAVAQGLTVGVDIEWVNAEFATEEIAEQFFAATEIQTLRALPSTQRAQAFFSCWTRKEAYVKALGKGLSIPLDSFAVAFGPGISAALLEVKVDSREVQRWRMYNVEVTEGYKAALVVEGENHQLKNMEWDESRFAEMTTPR